MNPKDLERQLRQVRMPTPNPAWKEEILSQCAQGPTGGPTTFPTSPLLLMWLGIAILGGAIGSFALLRDSYSQSHATPNEPHTMVESAPSLGLQRHSSVPFDWDTALLSGTDAFDRAPSEMPWGEIEPSMTAVAPILGKFARAIAAKRPLPQELPFERLQSTAEALTVRSWHIGSHGNVEVAYRDCLTLIQYAEHLRSHESIDAAIRSVGVVGMVLFPAGRGIDHGWDDHHLLSLANRLLTLKPTHDILAFLNEHPDYLSEEILTAWSQAWIPERNAFEFIPEVDESSERYRNVIVDTLDVEYRTQQVALAIAIEHHRREFGEVPELLNELVPSVLPAIPNNPWTNEPYAYEKTAPDNARVEGRPGHQHMTLRPPRH